MATSRQSEGAVGQHSDDIVARANEVYWNTGAGVNRLARELDLSKGALYEIINPWPAGLPCPRGDGDLVYANRTARERGIVSCPACGLDEEEERVRTRLEDALAAPASAPTRPPPHPARNLEKLLVVTALAGVAAGLLLSGVLRRR